MTGAQGTSPQAGSANFADAWRRTLFIALFTVSGFAGIIYESIWTHYLKLFLGHAAYAQALVLAIFMGGMALGAWLVAGASWRWRNLLRVYAGVELVIGVMGLAFHPVFETVRAWSFGTMLPALDSPAAVLAGKWGIATLLILPQSVLLGMTFPLMAGGIVRMTPGGSGESLASLYFCNSLGAAVGILASGFLLIAWAGLPGTIMTAAVINVLLAASVWLLAGERRPPASPPPGATVGEAGQAPVRGVVLLGLAVAFATGAASFFYEMAWIRMLSLVLGASTHSFELMLSAFILGLSLGSLWIRRRIDAIAEPVRFLGHVQVAMALLAIASLWLYADMFSLMKYFLGAVQRSESGYLLFNLFSHLVAMLIMLPATFCAGMTLPLITKILYDGGLRERSIGRVYSLNTVGAIVAVVLAIHVTLPVLGLKGTILAGAVIDILAGLVLLYRWRGPGRARDWTLAGGVSVAVVLSAVLFVQLDPRQLSSGVYRHGRDRIAGGSEMLFYRDGKTASISLYERRDGVRTLTSNGKPDASIQVRPGAPATGDEVTMTLLAVLPAVYHPAARNTVNVGIGSGQTSHVMLANPHYERVDTVEIEQAMVDAARLYGPAVGRVFADPRSQVHVEDAKTFMANQGRLYDLVISEPSNPWVSGVASLFTAEFYAHVRSRLAPGGIFVQWLHLYEFDTDLAFSVLKAISAEFRDYAIYNTTSADVLVVARADGMLPAPDYGFPFRAGYQSHLQRINVRSPVDLQVRRVGGRQELEALVLGSRVPANSDYFPYLDLNAPRARFLNSNAMQLSVLNMRELPYLQMLAQRGAQADLSRVSNDRYFSRAEFAWRAGEIEASLAGRGPLPPSLPLALQQAFANLALVGTGCGGAVAEPLLFRAMYDLAEAVNPYLPAPRLAAYWSGLVQSHPCAAGWSAELRDWGRLFTAVATHDATRMRQVARRLLAMERQLGTGPQMNRYLLHAVALGALVQEDYATARAALARVPRSERSGLEHRLLVAHARG